MFTCCSTGKCTRLKIVAAGSSFEDLLLLVVVKAARILQNLPIAHCPQLSADLGDEMLVVRHNHHSALEILSHTGVTDVDVIAIARDGRLFRVNVRPYALLRRPLENCDKHLPHLLTMTFCGVFAQWLSGNLIRPSSLNNLCFGQRASMPRATDGYSAALPWLVHNTHSYLF